MSPPAIDSEAADKPEEANPSVVSEGTEETVPAEVLEAEAEETQTADRTGVQSTMRGSLGGVLGKRVALPSALVIFLLVATRIVLSHIPFSKPSAEDDMRSFISIHRTNKSLREIQDLETDTFTSYAQAYCVTLDSADKVKDALWDQMDDLPMEAREKVIKRAVTVGATQKSSLEDSVAKIASEGKAYFFKAFWSTTYDRGMRAETYTTCVVVSGVEIGIAEAVAGWHKETKKVQVGVEKCDCGYILPCTSICPVFDDVTTETPIFKRHSLTLKQQQELHVWLSNRALAKAEELVGNIETSSISSSDHEHAFLAWNVPDPEPLFQNGHGLPVES